MVTKTRNYDIYVKGNKFYSPQVKNKDGEILTSETGEFLVSPLPHPSFGEILVKGFREAERVFVVGCDDEDMKCPNCDHGIVFDDKPPTDFGPMVVGKSVLVAPVKCVAKKGCGYTGVIQMTLARSSLDRQLDYMNQFTRPSWEE